MKNLDYKLDVMLRKTKIIISFANPENKTITQCTECWWLDNGHSNINSKERKMRSVNRKLTITFGLYLLENNDNFLNSFRANLYIFEMITDSVIFFFLSCNYFPK